MTEEFFYPGSKRKRGLTPAPEPLPEIEEYEITGGKTYLVGGQPVELFKIGTVAAALNRRPVTIRKWEVHGVLPRSPYKMPGIDDRGSRRLYTRKHIEDLRRIAAEEGILSPNANGKWKAVEATKFTEKAEQAFRSA